MTDEEAEMLGYEAMFASFVPKGDGAPLYTAAQLVEERRLAWNEAIEAAADWFADRFSDAVQADCESGVKWLNERAAKAYLKDAPDTLAAIREGEEAIRALTKDSTHD